MTQQFHEGQEVEVINAIWRKAKIVRRANIASEIRMNRWWAQFPDGSRAVFDEEHIRAIPNRDLAKMTSDELQEDVNDCYGGVRP